MIRVMDDGGRSAPELRALAQGIVGPPREALRRVLLLVAEQLGMDVAFVTTLTPDGRRVVRLALTADGRPLEAVEGLTEELGETWCGEVLARDGLMVADAATEPRLRALPSTELLGIGCHAGVPVRHEGRVIGTLCAVAHAPHASLNPRDEATLEALAAVAADWLVALDTPVVPRQRTPASLAGVAEAVTGARTVEELARPLLDALHDLTGLASTYLTVVHEEQDVQEIRYSRNARQDFAMPEGLHVPWADTLCKRALDEGRPCTTDVSGTWGDSDAARELGIEVYVSVPVALPDGRVWGTLCAADSRQAMHVEEHLPTMRFFGRLIAAEVERAEEAQRAAERVRAAEVLAETDALTGLASRRAVHPWLEEALAGTGEDVVAAAYIDVDDFKGVNDALGHAAGDRVLVEVAHRLRAASRPGDLVARMGGDEFVVAARMPRAAADAFAARLRSTASFEHEDRPVRLSVGIALSRSRDVVELLEAADQAMYDAKRS